ncbi:MAG: hypothetical protein LBE37_21615 [Sphingobacterium sp.]|jgi:hypothetical protein|nr:hypothetical protein [Sphingobacterium sp.]
MSKEADFVLSVINKTKYLLIRNGKIGFSFSELQYLVGCSRSKIYQYFRSKNEIYRILLWNEIRILYELIANEFDIDSSSVSKNELIVRFLIVKSKFLVNNVLLSYYYLHSGSINKLIGLKDQEVIDYEIILLQGFIEQIGYRK